jgi:hypothetical protein
MPEEASVIGAVPFEVLLVVISDIFLTWGNTHEEELFPRPDMTYRLAFHPDRTIWLCI